MPITTCFQEIVLKHRAYFTEQLSKDIVPEYSFENQQPFFSFEVQYQYLHDTKQGKIMMCYLKNEVG